MGRDEAARKPSDARLGHLTRKVFRIIQFAKYHIYDADRLLHAAGQLAAPASPTRMTMPIPMMARWMRSCTLLSLDGFENPSADINKHFRVGDLRPEAWFKFFSNVEPRDPNRGFRR